jgi:phage FluMu protein Com
MIKFRCTHCNKLLGGEDKQAGLLVTCPKCKEKTRIPKPGEAPKAGAQKVEMLEVVEDEEFEIVEDIEVIEEPEELDLADFEQEEELPRKKPRRPVDDDEEEERPRKKPRRDLDEDDEEDRPRKKRAAHADDEDDDEEDDDRPRRRPGKGKRSRRRIPDEPQPFFSRNRISGLLGIILGVFAPIGGTVAWLIMDPPYAIYYLITGIVLGLLFMGAGVVYMIIG